MGYEINWHVNAGASILKNEFYLKYSQYTFNDLIPLLVDVKTDMAAAMASEHSVEVINYLAWVIRTVNLLA
jgi:hypothetical protein